MTMYVVLGILAVIALFVLASYARRGEVIVYAWEHALLYIDGKFVRVLAPGRYRFWHDPRRRMIQRLASTDQLEQLAPIEVTSADKFPYRAGYAAIFRITDPRSAFENDHHLRLRLLGGQALLELLAERTLEQAMEDRAPVAEALKARLAAAVPDCAIGEVFVGPITLPPELRRLFTEVERAKIEGLAALERSRSEQAALRSLANAARLLKGNPELMRLRLLQAVSPTGKGATLVLGQDAIGLATAAAEEKPKRGRAKPGA